MEKERLKTLFKQSYNVDEKFLETYIDFLEIKETKEEGEVHHILPKSLFPEFSDLGKFPFNGVNLLYSDHVKAHYLLTRVIDNDQMIFAFNMMFSFKKMERSDILSEEEYNYLKSRCKDAVRKSRFVTRLHGARWMTKNGKSKHVEKEHIKAYLKNGWEFGCLNFKNKVWVNKDNINIRIKTQELQKYLQNGYSRGRTKDSTMQNKVGLYKDNKSIFIPREELQKFLNDEWKEGIISKSTKGMVRIFKGDKNKTINKNEIDKFLKDGWKLGSKQNHPEIKKGSYIYVNDGKIIKRIPPELEEEYKDKGFVRGQFKLYYVNNGIINKRVLESEIGDYLKSGWIRGMKKR